MVSILTFRFLKLVHCEASLAFIAFGSFATTQRDNARHAPKRKLIEHHFPLPVFANGYSSGDSMKINRVVIPDPVGLSGTIWATIRSVSRRDLC